jgi:hypothetical protein
VIGLRAANASPLEPHPAPFARGHLEPKPSYFRLRETGITGRSHHTWLNSFYLHLLTVDPEFLNFHIHRFNQPEIRNIWEKIASILNNTKGLISCHCSLGNAGQLFAWRLYY